MHYTENIYIPGVLLLIDLEKAFDSLSWTFIKKALNMFNFKISINFIVILKKLIKNPKKNIMLLCSDTVFIWWNVSNSVTELQLASTPL